MKRLGMMVCVLGTFSCSALADEPAAGASGARDRVGVYDSRAIAVAFVGSPAYKATDGKKMAEMMAEHSKAKAEGNQKRVAELEAWGKAQQALLHKQGFSTAPVDDILTHIQDQMPEIAKAAGVGPIVSKWDKVALSKYPSAELVDVTMELAKAETELETELIGALHRMRTDSPSIRFAQGPVQMKAVAMIQKCYLLILQIYELRGDRKKEALVRDFEGALSRSLKQVFELLGLVYPQEDIIKAYQNILLGTKKNLDYSVELLDNILNRQIKELLLPLIEDTTLEEKARISRKMVQAAEKIVFS